MPVRLFFFIDSFCRVTSKDVITVAKNYICPAPLALIKDICVAPSALIKDVCVAPSARIEDVCVARHHLDDAPFSGHDEAAEIEAMAASQGIKLLVPIHVYKIHYCIIILLYIS